MNDLLSSFLSVVVNRPSIADEKEIYSRQSEYQKLRKKKDRVEDPGDSGNVYGMMNVARLPEYLYV